MKCGAAALLLVATVSACTGKASPTARFARAGERAYAAGRYDEAAAEWERAATAATLPADRDEARYRQATSLTRGGRVAEARAVLERLLGESPDGARSARAAYDHALLVAAGGEVERSERELDELLERHAGSGVAAVALARRVDSIVREGEGAVRAYLERLLAKLPDGELAERLHYGCASSFEREGRLPEARDRYLLLTERFPYPKGRLWEDALWHAADLDTRLGAPEKAVRHLERMLRAREESHLSGSYERSRYGDAQYRIAELYRDALGDPTRARTAFERLFHSHRTSRLRDDAAWNAALIAARAGDARGACANLEALAAEIPESRYVPCAHHVCPSLEPRAGNPPCHEYLLRPPTTGADATKRP